MLIVIGITSLLCPILFTGRSFAFRFKFKLVKSAALKNWYTAKWSIGISLSDAIKNQLSIWILNSFLSTSVVGIYNVNNSFALLPSPAFNGLSQFLLPQFSQLVSQNRFKTIKKRLFFSVSLILLCNIFWMVALIFFGNFLIVWLYGAEYKTSIVILLLCCVRGVFTSLSSVSSSILQAIEKPQQIVKSLLFSIGFMLVFGILLTWRFGLIGMSVGMVLMYAINTITQSTFIYKWFKRRET